jgi:hypothetical protein
LKLRLDLRLLEVASQDRDVETNRAAATKSGCSRQRRLLANVPLLLERRGDKRVEIG